MGEVFLKILNMSLPAGVLIAAVILLRLVLKKAPRWIHCLLWALVAVRLVCPFQLESRLSLVPRTDVEGIVDSIVESQAEAAEQDALELIGPAEGPVVDLESEPVIPPADTGTDGAQFRAIPPTDLLAAVWLAGVTAMLLYALISYLRLRRRVAPAMSVGNGVWLCDEIRSPFLLGFVRPRIYLPSALQEPERGYVLAHERAHLKRRDHWWKPLGFLLLAVYWFHPLVWVAYILLCRDIELACDEKVIREQGEGEKKAYSEALLACSVKGTAITACPLAFGEVGVKKRIKSVLNYKKPAFWIIAAAVAVCIVLAVCFLTDPVERTENDPFGQSYEVTEITYIDGSYSFVMTTEIAPKFIIGADGTLTEQWAESERIMSVREEITLNRENFDDRFHPPGSETGMWEGGMTAAKLRRNNQTAWLLDRAGEGAPECILLQQKNGDRYLAYCLPKGDRIHSRIRWVFKLEQTDNLYTSVSTTGGAEGPENVTVEADNVRNLLAQAGKIAGLSALDALTLDEDGQNDDAFLLSIPRDEDGNRTGAIRGWVILGNGATLEWTPADVFCFNPDLLVAHLTDPERQSVVVQLPHIASTYGAAQLYVLEVQNGELAVLDYNSTRSENDVVRGVEAVPDTDSGLSCLRIPVLSTKWNTPEWHTLRWENGAWTSTPDGYFTDTHTLSVDGGIELTLALRGWHGGENYRYYDQIQILHGDTVLQTITEDSFTPDSHCPFAYLNADSAFHQVLTYDINFDGNTDFGIPCNTTHNDGHVWFLYDPQARQYRFAFSLAGEPIVDAETQRITEEWWDDSIYITYNTYEYDDQGKLTLIDSRRS